MFLEQANQLHDERWKSVYAWFERVMELPAGERLAFSQQAIQDPEVLRLVLDLLENQQRLEEAPEGAPRPRPGEDYGRFAIGELLGRGGMGEVYSARDTELNRAVAIKFVSPQSLGGSGTVERLIQEARAASTLNHPGIVTVHEVIRSEDSLAIVMERVDGMALRSLCGKPNPAAEVARLGNQIAEALAAAHAGGVVHRDIKPENLMVRPDGYVKVLDFGAAAHIATGDDLAGIPIGTLGYMSPEQIQGKPLTGASDVFSLGVVLTELASGRHPFLQDTAALTSDAIQTSEPGWLSAKQCKIAEPLGSLLRSMLAKEPGRRPSAVLVAARLAAITRKGGPRRVKSWLWLSGLAACIVCGFVLWAIAARIFAPKEPVFEQISMQASENRVTAAALSPDGEQLAFGALGGPIHLRRMNDGFTLRLNTPADLAIERIAWFADGSRLLVSGTRANHGRGIWVVPISGGKPSLIAQDCKDGVPSPDGTLIALASVDESTIWVKGVDGGAARKLRVGGNISSFSALVWLPDGKRIGYQRRDYAPPKGREVDPLPTRLEKNYRYSYESVDVTTARVVASAKDVPMLSACALRDGRILFLRWVSLALIWSEQVWELRTDVQTGRVLGPPRPITHGEDLALSSISASSDGKEVSVVWLKGWPNIYIADLLPQNSVPKLSNIRRLTFTEANDYPHAWTADNQSVIFESDRNIRGHNHYQLYRQNVAQAEAEPLCISTGNNVLEQLSPDGKWVLYRSDQGNGKRRLMRVSADGGQPEPVRIDGELDEFRCSLRRDGACVLRTVENGQFVFHELDPVRGEGRELGRTSWSPPAVGDWDLSPDGLEVAIPNHDAHEANIKLVGLTDRLAGKDEKTIRLSGLSYLDSVVWSADGRGWYVSVLTASGQALFYADEQGRTSELHVESLASLYVVPSRDGHRIAFPNWNLSSNAWLLRGL